VLVDIYCLVSARMIYDLHERLVKPKTQVPVSGTNWPKLQSNLDFL